MSDEEKIKQTAKELLRTLETPINGVPSVRVIHREHAERVLVAMLKFVWEVKVEAGEDHT